jgi:lipopolysaccharide assembly outer membrane protein LptD (OstA)
MKTINKLYIYIILFSITSAACFAEDVFERDISPEAEMAKLMEEVQINADKVSYDGSVSTAKAVGNAIIKTKVATLTADVITLNIETGDAIAQGNVKLVRGDDVWTGEELKYNFKDQTADADNFVLSADPFVIFSENAERLKNGDFHFDDATLTTCTNDCDHLHYRISVNDLTFVPGECVRGRNAKWYVGNVPIFYWPKFYSPLEAPKGWSFKLGYGSRWGAFLLSSYTFDINSWLESETHVDLRSKRGVGLGQDFRWDIFDNGDGEISGYYISDQDTEAGGHATEIDDERYRVKFTQDYNFTDQDYVLAKLQYVSDAYLLEDFFESEYKQSSVPENYLFYTHRADKWLLTGLAKGKLNDYYTVVSKYPEITFDVMRQEIADSGFYYDSTTVAGFMDKQFSDIRKEDGQEDYDVFRFHTDQFINYPLKFFGWLNMIPGADYQGTYYSKTKKEIYSVDQNGDVFEVTVEEGAELRSAVTLSLESSFKAYSSTWYPVEGIPIRHVAIPYVVYNYRPEPNLSTDQIYQFDDIDDLSEQNSVKLGMRNKIQRGYKQANNKRSIRNLIDVDVYTYLNLLEDETTFENLYLDSKLLPLDDMIVYFDMVYNFEEDYLDEVDGRLSYQPSRYGAIELEYLYDEDLTSKLTVGLDGYLTRKWTLGTYVRYDLSNDILNETEIYIKQVLDCIGWQIGLRYIPEYNLDSGVSQDEEWSVTFGFWLTDLEGFGVFAD